MKIKGENTIDAGLQFCNFKMSYELDFEDVPSIKRARDNIKEMLIEDMKELHHHFKQKNLPQMVSNMQPVENDFIIKGNKDVEIKWTFKDGKWDYKEGKK